MEEALVLAVFAALGWLWWDSMAARERAVAVGKSTCARDGLQFLDDTVECVSMRPARNEAGRLVLRRAYRFEFSDDGATRRAGSVAMLGAEVESVYTEPYLVQ
jgi:hypothetical protein